MTLISCRVRVDMSNNAEMASHMGCPWVFPVLVIEGKIQQRGDL